MPKFPKPFFRTGRGWYVQLGKEQIKLANGPQNADTEAQAFTRYYEIMAERGRPKPAAPQIDPATMKVVEVFEKYLDWCQKHRAGRTYEWYHDHLQSFLNHLGAAARMVVTDLKPFHVIEWADRHADWSRRLPTRGDHCHPAAIQLGRGVGLCRSQPDQEDQEAATATARKPRYDGRLRLAARPLSGGRSIPRSVDVFLALRMPAAGSPARSRPGMFNWPQSASSFRKRKPKGKQRPRVILLHGPALDIIRRLVQMYPTGKLFRNEDGRPWKRFAIANRFDRLMLAQRIEALKEAGHRDSSAAAFNRRQFTDKKELAAARKEHQKKLRERRKQILKLARQHGKKLAAYDLRHGFAQRLLESGTNHLAVAELMGHSTGRMVAETYSHMNKATAHLKEALKKADGDASA